MIYDNDFDDVAPRFFVLLLFSQYLLLLRSYVPHAAQWLHSRLGADCRVVLPALPLHWTTAFHQPLRCVVLALAEVWDDQKLRLAQAAQTAPVAAAAPTARQAAPFGSGGAVAVADAGDDAGVVGVGAAAAPPPGAVAGAVEYVTVPWAWRPGILAPDGVHPNEDGYELWADHIAEGLVAALRRPQPPPRARK